MLDESTIEARLANVEQMVTDLKRQVASISSSSNWLEQVIGSISDEQAFLQALEYGKAYRYSAQIFEELRGQRVWTATMDLRIASIALSRNLVLLTHNASDFDKIPGLTTENWAA